MFICNVNFVHSTVIDILNSHLVSSSTNEVLVLIFSTGKTPLHFPL